MVHGDQARAGQRKPLFLRMGILGLFLIGGAWVIVRLRLTQFLWPGPFNPRHLEVQVDQMLTPNGGWKAGSTPLSQPPDKEELVEVVPTRDRDGQLRVLVRHRSPPRISDTELSISTATSTTPSITVSGGTRESTSGGSWRYDNIGGLVRINSGEIPPRGIEDLIIEYRLVGDCAGSPLERTGKVVLTRDELR